MRALRRRPSHPLVPGTILSESLSRHIVRVTLLSKYVFPPSRPSLITSLLRLCDYLVPVANSPESLIRPSHLRFLFAISSESHGRDGDPDETPTRVQTDFRVTISFRRFLITSSHKSRERGNEGTRERGSTRARAHVRTHTRAHTLTNTHKRLRAKAHGGGGAESCIARIAARRHRAMRRSSRCLCVSRPSHPLVPGRTVRVIESPHRPDSQFVPLRLHSRSRPGHYLLRVTISSVSLLRPCEYLIRVAAEPLIRPSHHPFLFSVSPSVPALALPPPPPSSSLSLHARVCVCVCVLWRARQQKFLRSSLLRLPTDRQPALPPAGSCHSNPEQSRPPRSRSSRLRGE